MKKLLIACTAALMLTGCAAAAEPEPTKQVEEEPKFPATYRSVEELKDAFVEAGGSCPAWEQTNQVKSAAESGSCSPSNVLSVYTSESEKDAALTLFKSIAVEGSSLLVGENWIINDQTVKELDPALGGTFFSN